MSKSTTSSFALTLKLNTDIEDNAVLAKRFYCGMDIYNCVAKYAQKQIFKLWEDKDYRQLLSERQSAINKKDIAAVNDKLAQIRLSYGLSQYQFYSYVKVKQHRYKKHIDSRTAQAIAKNVWSGCESVLFGKGKKLHFAKYYDFNSMESNSNDTGIRYMNGCMVWNKLIIPVQLDKSDKYECEALKNKVKYCRIVRRPMGTKYHYYLQLILEGVPPTKHVYGTGCVGIDIGTSTCATASKDKVDLFVLGENIASIDKQIRKMQRAMERSKRATNPNNFNPDGTVKKGRLKWNFSKSYKHLRFKKRALEAKRASSLKQAHEVQANEVISQGDNIFVETMCFSGLQRKAKETTKNKKGKFNKKKRFGKSLQNHAPSMFIGIIDRKLGYIGKTIRKVNTKSFRASQYNHITDDYIKKKLSCRWNYFPDGSRVQRDLYSAFLLMNSAEDLNQADRNKCLKTYKAFKKQHDILINHLEQNVNKLPASFGIKESA